MSKNAILLGVGLVDNMSKDLARISKNLRANGRNLASVGSELTQGITLPVVAAGAAMLKFAGDLDAMKRALAANMGSASAAAVEFDKLRKAAEAPGIGLEEALRGSIQLQALGANADEARTMLLGLAKAVELSGGGQWEFGRLTTQFIQMVGNGRTLQEDLKFMFQAAPKLRGIVQDIFGTSDPEKLRGITNVKEFVEKTIAALNKLEGTGGSLKNTLENLWTSIKVGTGEIGLAILKVTGLGNSLDDLPRLVDDTVLATVQWIKENKGLVNTFIDLLKVLVITGPLTRLIGNMSMLAGIIVGIPGNLKKIALSLVSIDKAAKVVSLSAFGWASVAAAAVLALAVAAERLDKALHGDGKGGRKVRTDPYGQKYTQSLGSEIALGTEGRTYLKPVLTDDAKNSARGLMEGFMSSANNSLDAPNTKNNDDSSLWNGFDPPDDPAADEAAKKAQEAYEAKLKLQREMADMFANTEVPSLFEQHQRGKDYGLRDSGMKSIKPNSPIKQSDVKILEEYGKALAEISIEESLGATEVEAKAMAVTAASEAYRSMASVYGEGSDQAASALATWKTATEQLTDAQKEQNAELEKKNRILEYMQVVTSGVSESISGLLSDGGGFKEFSKGILKAASSMMKLALATFLQKQMAQPGVPLINIAAAAVGGGLLLGLTDSLINKVSLAEGGMLTGESLVRAGEYPGVQADPEVISPVSKIQKYIREAVGSGGGNMHAVIRGDDIHLVTSMAQDRASRRGSGNVISF